MRHRLSKTLKGGLLLSGSLWAGILFAAETAPLQAPEGFYQKNIPVAADNKNAEPCPTITVYQGALSFESKYEQDVPAKDQIDEEHEKQYLMQSKPMQDLQELSARYSDRLFKGNGSQADLTCVLSHWRAWADAGALLQPNANSIGKAVRKWTLDAIAVNYLKLKLNLSDRIPSDEQQKIEHWIEQLAEQVRSDYLGRDVAIRNNHDYWAAWGVMASGVILQRHDLFLWADSVLTTALDQVDAQGYLPTELKRRSRALYYHNFALEPLASMALFANNNEMLLSKDQLAALERLANMVLTSINNPQRISMAAGARQMGDDLRRHGRLAWLVPYEQLSGDEHLRSMIMRLQPLHVSRLGGDQVYLYLRRDAFMQSPQKSSPVKPADANSVSAGTQVAKQTP